MFFTCSLYVSFSGSIQGLQYAVILKIFQASTREELVHSLELYDCLLLIHGVHLGTFITVVADPWGRSLVEGGTLQDVRVSSVSLS